MSDAVVLGKHDDTSGLWHVFEGEGHLLTCGSIGSGKGQCHVIPNLWKYPGSVFVLDVKGDNYDASINERRSFHGENVYRFDVANPIQSARYNPLDFVSRDELDLWDECRNLAEMLVVPKADDYFEAKARDLVAAVLQYVLLCEDFEKNMTEVCSIIWADKEELDGHTIDMQALCDVQLTEAAKGIRSVAAKEFSGIINSARKSLEIWRSNRVRLITNETSAGWTPELLRDEGASVFVVVPPPELEMYVSLLRVMVGQHISRLMKDHGRKAKLPVMFILDEFPLLGYLKPIKQLLDVGRSYNLRGWLFIQNYGQLESTWSNPEGILSACNVQCFMDVNDPKTENLVLKQLPLSRGLLSGSVEPWLRQGELTGPDWKGKILVLTKSEDPIRLQKEFAWRLKPERF